jgi:hypothetical protein
MSLKRGLFFVVLLYTSITLAEGVTNPLDYMGQRDKERISEILQTVSKKSNMPTKEVHGEFWAILEKQHKHWSEKELETLKDQLVGVSLIYMKYYWEDALESLKKGSPIKNSKRADYENKLLKLGTLSQEKLMENDENIRRIAFREPLSTGGGPGYVVNEQGVNYVLSSLEAASERMTRLFRKEYRE